MRVVLLTGVIMLSGIAAGGAGEIEFVEDFALAKDREAALQQLIPGTQEFYYWTSIHLLNIQQYDKVGEVLKAWVARHGETAQVWEIRTRQALLSYSANPQKSLSYLRNRFGIHYPHRREELNAAPNLPTALAADIISRERFKQHALQMHGNSLNGFHGSAFEWLIDDQLNPAQRRQLLERLERPDYANLVGLIAADLSYPQSKGFGAQKIHRQLLKTQLDELLKLQPRLLNHGAFVNVYLTKLQPSVDVDWRNDPGAMAAYLDRLQAFADQLDPVHNSLKAHVLYHRLLLDRSQGKFDKIRFLAYLKLPRSTSYISKAMRESESLKRFACDLNATYDGVTLLPPIGNDEPLVRSYLAHFLVEADNTHEYESLINDTYLRHLYAETTIVNGLGAAEQWASQLPPEPFRQLRERVDIDFDFANKTRYRADDSVSLQLHIKNVSTLIVKVFEINTKNFYRQTGREIDTDINLDGLVANFEQTHHYDDPPLRRITRKFDFPMLDHEGIYVIDFIGNGQSSRALIRKGRLHHLIQTTPIGQSFTILDENNQQVKDACVWVAGHEYRAERAGDRADSSEADREEKKETVLDGTITVPFSTQPGHQAIVISAPIPGSKGETYSALASFQHEGENYEFKAGFYVDRESLLRGKKSQVVIRPGLSINGTPVSLKLLEDVKLVLTSTDLDGTSSSVDLPAFKLYEDRDAIHDFLVPQRLVRLHVRLSAKITSCITGKKIDLAAEDSFSLNGIDRTDKMEDLHLLQAAGQYTLELRGRTGEPMVARPVSLTFQHRDFRDAIHIVLKTDPQGRVALGKLTGIRSFAAKGPEETSHSWSLIGDRHTFPRTVHERVGEPITLPYLGSKKEVSRDELSLLQLSGNTFGIDRFDHLSLDDGLLVIKGLPAGDYDLLYKMTGTRIAMRVAEGHKLGRYIVGPLRQLETSPLKPLQIESITPTDDTLNIQLRNVSKFARVHIYASRYVPEYDVFSRLGKVRGAEPYMFWQRPAPSVYLTGRNIGDEYRYIIDRRYATKYPGNMLQRPSLLLNPWAVRDTQTGAQVAAAGGEYGETNARPESAAQRGASAAAKKAGPTENFADLDFLATTAGVLLNLTPDEKGVIEVPRDALGPHQYIQVVAVDPLNTTSRCLTLPEPATSFVDLRLLKNLDPKSHYTQQKQISIVPAGQTFTLHDITTAKFESYDSLARVYALYTTLNNDSKLVEFLFLLNWPNLKADAKQELYSKHASHELSFFLFKKDPEFFRAVVQPYLVNKKDKTFMDHFLLEDNLADYLQPWKYGQLNTVERILLARRIQGEGERTSRHVSDLYALLPPNTDRFIHLFDTAAQSSALNTNDALGLTRERLDYSLNGQVVLRTLAEAAPPAAPSPALAADTPSRAAGIAGKLGRAQQNMDKATYEFKRRALSSRQRKGYARDKDGKSDRIDLAITAGDMDADAFFDDRVVEKRKQLRQLYRKLEKTREWAENNYHHLTIDKQDASLVTVNAFWKDFAAHDPTKPFLSRNLAEASRNFPEMIMALAVLDLPFDAPEHKSTFDGTQMTLVPGGPLVVYHEEIRTATAPEGPGKLLVTQNFFKRGDRQRTVNGEKVDKFITDEFLIHTVYGCQVVITNPTSTRQKLNVLVQIPRGAIALLGGKPTNTLHIDLKPYHTQTIEYHFYFPKAGQFPHFPVHVAKNEKLVAAADPMQLTVVDRPTKIDTESWDYISQYGSLDDVVAFLDKHNIDELNLERIAWRMHDREAFERILAQLQQRHVYNHTLWSYALQHNAVPAARQYLQHADQIVNQCGGPLHSTLLTIDPVVRRTYEHLEYKPLVNARSHALGKRRQIVNDRLHWQYHRFLKGLAYQRELDDHELLTVTYYLLLQDRVEEALDALARVNRDKITTQLQYDYCAAYLKFFSDEPEQARAIAEKYVDHPVDRWRNTFATIVAQLDEASGKNVDVVDAKDRDQQQAQLAATQPDFDFTVEARKIHINHQNLTKLQVNFYQVDVELLFSRNPFVHEFGDTFASIKPNHSLNVSLSTDRDSTEIDLPDELRNSNVLIEIVGGGETQTQPYFSNSLAVQVIENYGQIKVTQRDTHKPVAKAYVKVYAQTAQGKAKLYKDGYTDLRGRFDYASLSTDELDGVQKFSVLVLSDQHGALVREATPPKQ